MTYAPICARAQATRLTGVYPSILPKRKKIDIQSLLVWAYRDQMVHGASPDWLMEMGEDRGGPGVRDSDWAIQRLDASVGGAYGAPADAWRVHRAVLGLGTAECVLGPGPAIGPGVHESVLPSYERRVIVGLPALVMSAALRGPPDWIAEPELRVRRGETIWLRRRNGEILRERLSGQQIASLCVVRFEGDAPWLVERARVIYGLWVGALARLRESLGGSVQAFEVMEALPPREPWHGA